MKKILVTGGSGFIGSHLINALNRRNYEVIIYDLSATRIEHKAPGRKVSNIRGDVLDKRLITEVIAQSDYIFHLAAILGSSETLSNIYETVKSNILGTLNILEAIKSHKKSGVIITIGGIDWLNPYAITKLAAERFSLMYAKEFDLDIKVVRGLNTYGPKQKYKTVRKAVPTFVMNALQNKPLEIYGDGNQILDLVYVEDLVEIMVRAMMTKRKILHIIEAGTGVKTTVNQLAKMIILLTNSRSKLKYLPMRPGEPDFSMTIGNVDTLRELIYVPSTRLEEGLKKTIVWYKNILRKRE